ncbi:hypothetical protein Tco_0105708 [Tanacetum coccineum]
MTGVKSRGFCATRECNLMDEDGPRDGHPNEEIRMTRGVPSLAVLCSWNALRTSACTNGMLATLPLSKPYTTITSYLTFLSSDDDTTDSDTQDTPPSPTHGHPVDHSSSDYFSLDDSARDSSSDSSSEASSDFHSNLHQFFHLALIRRRSLTTSVPALSLVSGALSPVRADLIPSPKRVKDSSYLADVEVDPREISLRDDAIVRVSDEPHLEQDIDPEIQAEIDECIAYADALRDRGIVLS